MTKLIQVEELEGNVLLATLDVPGKKVNTMAQPVMQEIAALVDEWEKRTDVKGLLFISGKPGQFIAGADLNELGAMVVADKSLVAEMLEKSHGLFDRISHLPFPTVALIDGNCMGGGTELSLALDYRIVSDNRKTKVGLPEVKIGLIPGWGGTQRMPRLIGIHKAIDMICSGDPMTAAQARDVGFAFDAVPTERLVEEGQRLLNIVNESGEWKEQREKRDQPIGMSEDQMNFTFAVSEGHVRGVTKGHYPAPLVALKAMREGVNLPLSEGLAKEREGSMEVIGSTIAGNLISVFFANNQLSRDSGVEDSSVVPRKVGSVGVLGGGLMGSGITAAHARSGIATTLVEIDKERVDAGVERVRYVVESRMKAGRAKPKDLADMLGNLTAATSKKAFADCDVVVEAITENEKLKTEAYQQLGEVMRDDAILATNTSTISITRMAESARDPERFIGMHFFLPVDRMQLVEIIRGEKTDDETVATIVQLTKNIRKVPVVVNDCPGFLVNRILLPYMNEALVMLCEGAHMDQIDKAATKFGMPVGPLALHDMVGIDTSCFAGEVLIKAYSDRAVDVPIMKELMKAGRLGKKTGAGFRKFAGTKGRPVNDPEFDQYLERCRTDEREFTEAEIQDRLFISMLTEAARIMEENIVREPSHADMGMILGTGFPPFRGGLLKWCDTEGVGKLVERASELSPLGKRFEPPKLLRDMAASNELFYPLPKVTG